MLTMLMWSVFDNIPHSAIYTEHGNKVKCFCIGLQSITANTFYQSPAVSCINNGYNKTLSYFSQRSVVPVQGGKFQPVTMERKRVILY